MRTVLTPTIIPAHPGYSVVTKYSDNGPRLYLTPIVAWGIWMTADGRTPTGGFAFLSTVYPITADGGNHSCDCAIRFPDGRTVVHERTFGLGSGEYKELLNYMDSTAYIQRHDGSCSDLGNLPEDTAACSDNTPTPP